MERFFKVIIVILKKSYFSHYLLNYRRSSEGQLVSLPNLTNICNEQCYCDQTIWEPVCHVDQQLTYFSPCFAGCRQKKHSKKLVNTSINVIH